MFSRRWWKAVTNRAVRSAMQGFVFAVGTNVLGWMTLDWRQVAVTSVGMGVLSVATSIISSPLSPEEKELESQ